MNFSPDNADRACRPKNGAVSPIGFNGSASAAASKEARSALSGERMPMILRDTGILSINGTFEEVATFFRVTVWTVNQWKKEKVIGHWQHGRNVMFGEESVLDFYVAKYSAARGLAPGEAREIGRREWREHLGVHRAEEQRKMFEDMDRRCADMEKRLAALERAA